MRSILKKVLILFSLVILLSCEKIFDYSIYSAKVEENDKETRKTNFDKLRIIEESLNDTSSFSIALISDSHTYYDDLNEGVDKINADNDISFIIHGGDMTDGGLLTEFYIFRTILQQFHKPYFTVIGNHDCLANGRRIYIDMFGTDNYSFEFAGCKFIFFNDVIWEMDYKEPDFLWLKDELADGENYRQKFVITHIPPWDDQFTPLYSVAYEQIVDSENVSLSIHGHLHHHNYPANYEVDGTRYLIIGSPQNRSFVKMKVSTDTVIVQNIGF